MKQCLVRSETAPHIGPGLIFVGDSMDDVISIIHRSVSVARLRYVALLPLAPCCNVGSCSGNPFACRGRHCMKTIKMCTTACATKHCVCVKAGHQCGAVLVYNCMCNQALCVRQSRPPVWCSACVQLHV